MKKMFKIIGIVVTFMFFSLVANAATIVVTWNANVETDLAGYGIYDNNVLVGSTAVLATPTFSILNAVDGVHSVTLDAFDTSGNRSLKSDAVSITIDTVPCAIPAKPTAVATGSSVKLTWVANTDADLAGYGIYHDGVLAGSIGVMASPTYTVASLPDGSHTFTIDSVDTAGNRSAKSAATIIATDISAPVKPTNLKVIWSK